MGEPTPADSLTVAVASLRAGEMGEVNGGHKHFNLPSNAVKTKTAGAEEGKQIKHKESYYKALQSPNKNNGLWRFQKYVWDNSVSQRARSGNYWNALS